MALDRWIALVILIVCLIYGYTAWFTMDGLLPPIMQRNPVWPSSFPKILSIMAIMIALMVIFGLEKEDKPKAPEINYRRLTDYKLTQALILIGLMVLYAFCLRPAGFLLSTFVFLGLGAVVLGERRFVLVALVSAAAALGVWYLVEQVLGIFLRPFPIFV